MSQISDELNSRIDIVELVSRYVNLKKVWSNYVWLCPFHNEKTPSFVVSPTKQIFKCFGCWEWWNALSFFMKIERLDWRDAVVKLSEQYKIDISKYKKLSKQDIEKYQWEKEKLKYMFKLCQKFFLENYKKSEKVQNYLKQTRALNDNIITKFWLWYAPDNHFSLVNYLQSKWFWIDDLQEASLAKVWVDNQYYSFFKNRLTIPIFDNLWHIVWFWARALDSNDSPKYLNTKETLVYKKSEILYWMNFLKENINKFDKLVIVEWYFDVIAFHKAWFPIAVATCWTALTSWHIKLIKRYTENVYFLFDSDEAWQNATIKALKVAYWLWVFPNILSLPWNYKDIDELVKNEKNYTDLINDMFEKSIFSFDWLINYWLSKFDVNSPTEKQKLLQLIFELIRSMHSFSLQQDYLDYFANKINAKFDLLLIQYKQFCKNTIWWQKRFEEKEENKTWTVDRMKLFKILIESDLLKNYDLVQNEFILLLKDLYQFVKDDLKFEDKQEMLELQLRWENQFDKLDSIQDKIGFIKQILLKDLNLWVLKYLKVNQNLNLKDKQKVINILNSLKK